MFGSILSSAVKVATLPLDVTNSVVNVVSGGQGSKQERERTLLTGDLEKLRDELASALEDLD